MLTPPSFDLKFQNLHEKKSEKFSQLFCFSRVLKLGIKMEKINYLKFIRGIQLKIRNLFIFLWH